MFPPSFPGYKSTLQGTIFFFKLVNISNECAMTVMGTKEMECSELKDGGLPPSVKPGFHSNWKCAWTSPTECSHEPTYLRRWLFVDYGKTLEQNHLDIMQVHSATPMAIILLKGSIQATSGVLDKQTNTDALQKLAHSFWRSTCGSSMTPKEVSFRVPPNCICYSAPRRHTICIYVRSTY